MKCLVLNPGGTSTKIAVFCDNRQLFRDNIVHHENEFSECKKLVEQGPIRKKKIIAVLENQNIDLKQIDCVVGRGGLLNPVPGGTYRVNRNMLEDLKNEVQGGHPSNLGALLAYEIAEEVGVPAYVVDPVAVDEFDEISRITGISDISKASWLHALNQKAVCRKVAQELGGRYQDYNFIVAHLGSGNSFAAHKNGRMIDGSGGRSDGPFSPERCGGLPTYPLLQLLHSEKYTISELTDKVSTKSGFFDYLGTKDLIEVERRINQNDEYAKLIMDAYVYQIAKEIAMYSIVTRGKIDAIILTGGIANSQKITSEIEEYVGFLAPVYVVPGELEMEALAAGAYRVMSGEESELEYDGGNTHV